MKRVIITSKKFVGEIHILYDEGLKLQSIDFQGVDLTLEQIAWIKNRTPVELYAEYAECFAGAGLEFILADYEITFEMFWDAYGEKVNKDRCKALWARLKTGERIKAFAGVRAYDRHLASLTWNKNKADPETYLKKKYWNNEWK